MGRTSAVELSLAMADRSQGAAETASSSSVPVPAIVFLCLLIGCIVVLCIVYQLLKRDMCCKFGGVEEEESPKGNGYTELQQDYYGDDTEFGTTDEDILGPASSKDISRRSSRRSSFDIGSKSDGDLALGESASTYGFTYGQTASESEISPLSARRVGQNGSGDNRLNFDEPEPVSVAGKILLEFHYSPGAQKLNVSIIRADEIPSKARGGASTAQVRLVLLPLKRQRFKTKVRPAANPVFNETFSFAHMNTQSISESTLRVRLYGHERVSKDRLIGEIEMKLSEVDLDSPMSDEQLWKTLTPRGLTSSDSLYDLTESSSLQSFGSASGFGSSSSVGLGHGGGSPELLVSLCYASLTGRLTVEVLKASNLRTLQMPRAPDTYVKIQVLSCRGRQVSKSKTTVRRAMADPEYNESFVFQMSEADLQEVTITFTVVALSKARKRKDIVGWFALGKNSSGESERKHWGELKMKSEAISHWHSLSAST